LHIDPVEGIVVGVWTSKDDGAYLSDVTTSSRRGHDDMARCINPDWEDWEGWVSCLINRHKSVICWEPLEVDETDTAAEVLAHVVLMEKARELLPDDEL